MKAFDADVLTLILQGDPAFVHKASLIPILEQGTPVVVIEEILRGRLNVIRQAQAEKSKLSIDQAYRLLELAIADFQNIKMLSHTSQAETLVKGWRKQKIRIGSGVSGGCQSTENRQQRYRTNFSEAGGQESPRFALGSPRTGRISGLILCAIGGR